MRSVILLIALIFVAGWSVSSDARDWGLEAPAMEQEFTSELDRILRLPLPPVSRTLDPFHDAPSDIRPMLRDNDDLGRAYQRDPEATLDLIRRVRQAGGSL